MSKKFLVLGAVVTTLVLLFAACAQPTELDGASISVNNFGVEPPRNVQAVAYTGAVRLTWEAPQTPANGYYITRQVKDSADPAVVIGQYSSGAFIYVDSTLTGDTKLESGAYIYKVVSYNDSYLGVGRVTAESDGVEVTVTVPARGSILPMPAALTLETAADPVPVSNGTGNTYYTYYFKVSGLNPLYTYSNFTLYSTTTPTSVISWGSPSNLGDSISLSLNSSTFDGVYYFNPITVDKGPTGGTITYKIVATVGVNTSNGYSYNGWRIANTSISTAGISTDSAVASTNRTVIGTF